MEAIDFSGKNLMVVAHPDDETMWGGSLPIRYPGDWFIVCCTVPKRDPERDNQPEPGRVTLEFAVSGDGLQSAPGGVDTRGGDDFFVPPSRDDADCAQEPLVGPGCNFGLLADAIRSGRPISPVRVCKSTTVTSATTRS